MFIVVSSVSVRSFQPGEDVLCANRERHVQPLLAVFYLLHDARVTSSIASILVSAAEAFWPIVISAELAVETRKVVVRLIHWPDALDIIAEPIAMPAGE